MVYKDFFLYTQEYSDFHRGFELTQEIVGDVRNRIRGFNFNRYSACGEGGIRADPREHITVRIDTDDADAIQCVEARLQFMKDQGEIQDWARGEDTPFDIEPMREYPPVYHTAHETSTACSLRFYLTLRSDPSECQKFIQSKTHYLRQFLPLWLRDSGFMLLASFSVQTYPFVERLAAACSESFKSTVDKVRISDTKIFTERVVHLFLNCVSISCDDEVQLMRSILTSLQFQNLDELWRRLGASLVDC